jgi:hypothetical protein
MQRKKRKKKKKKEKEKTVYLQRWIATKSIERHNHHEILWISILHAHTLIFSRVQSSPIYCIVNKQGVNSGGFREFYTRGTLHTQD